MTEVIYTRESTRNPLDEAGNTRDESIEECIEEIMKRSLLANPPAHMHKYVQKFSSGYDGHGDAKIVGSTIDGTKLGMLCDTGDYDMLKFSTDLTFDVDDELVFEYRDDDPYFLRIPQPKQLENKTSTVDGVYMSAHDLRFFRFPLFSMKTSRNYASFPYDLAPFNEVKSLHKCATTKTLQHSAHDGEKSSAIHFGLECNHWELERTLLTYLLHLKNGNNLQFVRELLFDDFEGDCETVREQLESILSAHKVSIQKSMFHLFDISYFNGGDFKKSCKSVFQQGETHFDSAVTMVGPNADYSTDLVPAIKCSGWPRPAMDWMDRPRLWPDENVVEDIVSSGFELVAKSPPIDPTPEKDFILSFSLSEIKLIQALPNTAKISYRVLKLCYKSIKADVSEAPTLKSFHLKSALFWVAERTRPGMWEANGIVWGIRAIINFLLSKLEQGHLPAFFIPNSNLIPHFRVNDIKRLSGILHSIRENPACYIKLMIEKQINYLRSNALGDTFKEFFDQGDLEKSSWRELMGFITVHGYQIHQTFDYSSQIKTTNCLLNCDEGSSSAKFTITDSQLKYVDLFAKTVASFKMDLFNALDQGIDSNMLDLPLDWIDDSSLKLYPSYDAEEDKQCGQLIYNAIKLRLEYYRNSFQTLCCKLVLAVDRPGMLTRNQDFNKIVIFLNKLKQTYRYSDENIEDLLHYLLYFCHFTKLRHHSSSIAEQILRSICEFLQNAQVLMTVYFNPKTVLPEPVVCFNISLLEQINE